MIVISRALVLCLLIALSGGDRTAGVSQSAEQTGAAVMAYERARTAAVRRSDEPAYRRLTSPSLTIVNPDGTLIGRDEQPAGVRARTIQSRRRQVDEYLNTRVFGDLAIVSGRSSWRHPDQTTGQEYFLRVWERSSAGWHLIAAHYTDVPRYALNHGALFKPPSVLDPAEPVIVRAIDSGRASPAELLDALHQQHRLFWEKKTPLYSQYVGDDVLRIAEMGVRTKADLLDSSQHHLNRPPSPQVDKRVHVVGNAATVIWRDAGADDDGRPTQSWNTMVFVKRDGQWQIVQMHSTRIPPERAIPVP